MRTRLAWLSVLLLPTAGVVLATCHEWDPYDPRLDTSGGSTSGSSTSTGTSTSTSSSGTGGAGGGVVDCTPDLPSDNFDMQNQMDAGLDADTWELYPPPSEGAVIRLATDQALFNIRDYSGSGAFARVKKAFPITGCRVFIKLTQVPLPAADRFVLFALEDDAKNALVIIVTNKNLHAKQEPVVEPTQDWSRSYDPLTDVYLAIREQGGTVYWETSKDGSQWTQFYKLPNKLPDPHVRFRMGVFVNKSMDADGGDGGAIGATKFDNFNTPP